MKETHYTSPYELEGRLPLGNAILLGLQHVLAMFASNLTPILLIAGACGISAGDPLQVVLLQNAMILAGVVTLVQLFTIGPIGGRLPIVMGTSSGFIGVCRSAAAIMGGGIAGYGAILGASVIGGLFETVLGFFLKPLRRFFSGSGYRNGCYVHRTFTDFRRYRFFWRRQQCRGFWILAESADRNDCIGGYYWF